MPILPFLLNLPSGSGPASLAYAPISAADAAVILRRRRYVPPAAPLKLREAVVQALLGDATVSGIINASVFPLVKPEGENLPALLYEVHALDRTHTLGGYSKAAIAAVRIGCASLDLADCQSVSIAIKALFDPDTFPRTLFGVRVWETVIVNEQDLYFDPVDDSEYGTHMIVVDYDFHYHEA